MLYIKRDYGTFTDSTIATSVSQNTTIQNIKITTNNKYDNIIYDQMGTNTKIINNTLTINNTNTKYTEHQTTTQEQYYYGHPKTPP